MTLPPDLSLGMTGNLLPVVIERPQGEADLVSDLPSSFAAFLAVLLIPHGG